MLIINLIKVSNFNVHKTEKVTQGKFRDRYKDGVKGVGVVPIGMGVVPIDLWTVNLYIIQNKN